LNLMFAIRPFPAAMRRVALVMVNGIFSKKTWPDCRTAAPLALSCRNRNPEPG
jgi:hypothetical protein